MVDKLIETTRAAWRLGMPAARAGDVRVAAPAGAQQIQMRQHNPASGLPLVGDGKRDIRGNAYGTLDAQLEC